MFPRELSGDRRWCIQNGSNFSSDLLTLNSTVGSIRTTEQAEVTCPYFLRESPSLDT